MTGDDDDDDRPDQTKTNTKRMDHAICNDLAAVIFPRESCRSPKVDCHSCDHEDRLPINPPGGCRSGALCQCGLGKARYPSVIGSTFTDSVPVEGITAN